VKRRPKLRLVGLGGDPTDVFDDMDKLRAGLTAPLRQTRATETFARIPYDRALELYRLRIDGPAWAALIELDRMVFTQRGKNPVSFWSSRLRAAGLVTRTRTRALRQLEAAGVIKIEQRGKGLSPLVTHFWYPRQD
jgi:hypothetical protein